jgi:hypothetical protein
MDSIRASQFLVGYNLLLSVLKVKPGVLTAGGWNKETPGRGMMPDKFLNL